MNSKKILNTFSLVVLTAISFLSSSCASFKYFDEDLTKTTFYENENAARLIKYSEIYNGILNTRKAAVSKLVSIDRRTKRLFTNQETDSKTTTIDNENYQLYKDAFIARLNIAIKGAQDGELINEKYEYYLEKVDDIDRYYKRTTAVINGKKEMQWYAGYPEDYALAFYDSVLMFQVDASLFYWTDKSNNIIVAQRSKIIEGSDYSNERQIICVYSKDYYLKEHYEFQEIISGGTSYEDPRATITKSLTISTLNYGNVKGYPNKDKFIENVPNEYLLSVDYTDMYAFNIVNDDIPDYNGESVILSVNTTINYSTGLMVSRFDGYIDSTGQDRAVLIWIDKDFISLKGDLDIRYYTETQDLTEAIAEFYGYETRKFAFTRDWALMIVPANDVPHIEVAVELNIYDKSYFKITKL